MASDGDPGDGLHGDLGDSRDLLAAEYALGTLDPPERDEAQALIVSEPAFAAMVRRWEARLGELNALSADIDPPLEVWEAIRTRLAGMPPSAAMRLPELPLAAPAPPVPNDNIIDLARRLGRWRAVAVTAGTMAALLALFIASSAVAPTLVPDRLRFAQRAAMATADGAAPAAQRYVAVLQRDAVAPAFILTIDLAHRSLTVRRVAAGRESGKSYELWLVSSRFPAPRSLGLVGDGEFTQSDALSPYDPAILAGASFAVSLEPEGGSPSGAPSNVMFLGQPVETVPAPAEPR